MTKFFVIVLILVLSPTTLSASTWYIMPDSTGDAVTIQAGIDSAAAGDTVLVAPGSYYDERQIEVGGGPKTVNVYLYKNIVLIADDFAGNASIGSSHSDFVVFAENVDTTAVVKGFTITTGTGGYGCGNDLMSDTSFLNYGIRCQSASLSIINNEIFANNRGISLESSSAYISGNLIHNSRNAFELKNGSDAKITNNTVFDCDDPLNCSDSSPLILDNSMSNTYYGLSIGNNCNPYISGNKISHLRYYEAFGIHCISGATIINNQISGAVIGIQIAGSSPQTRIIRNNLIHDSSCGITLHSADVLVENNTIDNALIMGIENRWGAVIRNNIISRAWVGMYCNDTYESTIECNNIYGSGGSSYSSTLGNTCTDKTGINGNISIDPQFCGIDDSGNYYLQSDSPCAPGNHPDGYDSGLIGAFPVNCGLVDVKKKSLGSIKALFDNED